ncbi:MAG: DPP IV N-terminal domain-containing protein [Rikenellaceae bacterium]
MKKIVLLTIISLFSFASYAQENMKELYQKADNYYDRYSKEFYGSRVRPSWIGKTPYFWYSVYTQNGTEYFMVDAAKQTKSVAFNRELLASAIAKETGEKVDAKKLPIERLSFNDTKTEMTFKTGDSWFKSDLKKYKLTPTEALPDDEEWEEDTWSFPNEDRPDAVVSPDGKKEAFISEGDLFVREKESGKVTRLSNDGSPTEYYSSRIFWSPDSKKIVSSLYRPVKERQITLVESSPKDQLEPIYHTFDYAKPGDAVPVVRPVLFDVESGKQMPVKMADPDKQFYQYWVNNNISWRKDSKSFTFTYNKRGHSQYIVYKVDAATGESKELINETSDTFIDHQRVYIKFLEDSGEVLWLSERDGWRHLYIYDYNTGASRQVTKGEWVVRSIENVDLATRTIILRGLGVDKGEDPYLIKYYSLNMDSGKIVALTPENGYHSGYLSPDNKYLIDTYSRVDQAPVTVLRDAKNGKVLMEVNKADISAMLADGYRMPEPFVAKGRDGVTDIYGIILRPTNFDPSKKYPVIENIYAGPHNSFVPKTFGVQDYATLCELGFIVVQIDGMGTNNRSKAFHDVCWKNLKDSGFPDRIAWMKAAAAKYPEMDISNVAVYGFSAGGQSTMSALLFFGDFYKVGAASCGCYDNRMDKIWWNEQWMGEVGDHYDASSSSVHAANLKGKLMLILGEIDDNVDPSSTMQVIDKLIEADKEFEFVILPGVRHTEGEKYGERKRRDFFVRNLLKQETPNWNN